MKVITTMLVACAIVMASTLPPVQAAPPQKVQSKQLTVSETLPAGGRTIGGPGFNTLAPGEEDLLFFFQQLPPGSGAGTLDICITLVNTGEGKLELTIFPSGAVVIANPGRSRVHCEGGVQNGGVECVSTNASCTYLWRIDSAD